MSCASPAQPATGKGQVKPAPAPSATRNPARIGLREAKQFNPREFRIMASQVVVDMFPGRRITAFGHAR